MPDDPPLFVITGGHGFIGSHVSARLHADAKRVRVVDVVNKSLFTSPISDEVMVGDLCDSDFCNKAVQGAHTVLHFAAAMGGMGTIHESNDFIIYEVNSRITANVVSACRDAGVKRLFYASSACIYPDHLQSRDDDVSLREQDALAPPIHPQGLYGLEKLQSEFLISQFRSSFDIRIARFHNVFGPWGSWSNGREKVPAALIRKAHSLRVSGPQSTPYTMEIWGNGDQRRSFIYIDDAVDAILLLLESDFEGPVNVGSDQSITILDLARKSLESAGVDPSSVIFQFDLDKPTGVASRNSNNELIFEKLGWSPRVSLTQGMQRTTDWIRQEIDSALLAMDEEVRRAYLCELQQSQVVDLKGTCVTFAILLPITSRGTPYPSDCLNNLSRFARSLEQTTQSDRDPRGLTGTHYRMRVYLAIDHDDDYLLQGEDYHKNKAVEVLHAHKIWDVVTLEPCHFPRGHVCALWRATAERAWVDKCNYFVLMGDDVVVQDIGWMKSAHERFQAISQKNSVPLGFGCVAFTDTSFPGMPTFPIIGSVHMDIFGGQVVPEVFINQDGDPFLFQLYRRWGCSYMFESRLRNTIGGGGNARYEQKHASGWTFDTLDRATEGVEAWLHDNVHHSATRKLTIDVVVPCYRVQLEYLEPILNLKASETCSVMFIIIVDDPRSPSISELQKRFGHRADVRIRVNTENLGASASRNRGMFESSAEWVHFLDDDISPDPSILIEAEKVIRLNRSAAGFIGNVTFPPSETVFTSAVHLAGVLYFWDIASKMHDSRDMPWGVTASLIARRNVKDEVVFNPQFPKTGGGEDIDFCRMKRQFSLDQGNEGFLPAPDVKAMHPWWNSGRRSYWRFYMWSKGDGALVKLYPTLTYRDASPNSAELLCMAAILLTFGACHALVSGNYTFVFGGVELAIAIVLANIAHDLYRHLFRNADRTLVIDTSVCGTRWALAVVESTFIRMFSEAGRVVGLLEQGDIKLLGRRFDWFAWQLRDGPMREERLNSMQRAGLVFFFLLFLDFMVIQ
ncbi:NAD-dependent epimerase/dehydratase [Amylostereum chailletii]|nr:NAD-dependent epimerase/dehydratase [Amylostereum chailletii]